MNNGIEVEGMAELSADLTAIVRMVEKEGTDLLGEHAESLSERAVRAASAVSRQARLAATGVRGSRAGRGGQLLAGGPGRLPTGHGTYGDLFFGAEFGGGSRPSTRQFKPYQPEGSWFFPTVEEGEDDLDRGAEHILNRAANRWAD